MSKFDVFISHSHNDKKIADAICHEFEQERIRCWIAPRDISGGTSWAGAIARAIPSCSVLLLIFSADSNMSNQVQREVELAVKYKLIIVPVKIEDINPSASMEYYLSSVHWIDVVNKSSKKYIKDLTESIRQLLPVAEAAQKSGERLRESQIKEDEKIIAGTQGDGGQQKKRKGLFIALAAAVIILAAIGLFVFRDSIFSKGSKQISQPTAVPAPTATVDPNISPDTIVTVENTELRDCIINTLEYLGYENDGQITVKEMESITELYVLHRFNPRVGQYEDGRFVTYALGSVNTLEGLQYAVNLQTLVVLGQSLSDISALSQIEHLTHVDIGTSVLDNVEYLRGHKSLIDVNISSTNVTDIEPLSSLQELSYLSIHNTDIENLDLLLDLPNLIWVLTDTEDYESNKKIYQKLRDKGCQVVTY